VSADTRKVEASGWTRPLEALAEQPARVREGLAAHLDFRFAGSSKGDALKESAEIIDADRKGIIARLNGWRTFVPGRNVKWAEVVDRMITAFGSPSQLDQSVEQREQQLQKLFHKQGLPAGPVVFGFADAVEDGQPVKGNLRRVLIDPVRIVMQTLQGLAALYTAEAAPAINCVYAILEMLHPGEVEAPFRSLGTSELPNRAGT
jgi:hypothetical protein